MEKNLTDPLCVPGGQRDPVHRGLPDLQDGLSKTEPDLGPEPVPPPASGPAGSGESGSESQEDLMVLEVLTDPSLSRPSGVTWSSG